MTKRKPKTAGGIPVAHLQKLVGMSPRATAALQAAGLETVEMARERGDAYLLALPGFGPSSLQRLRAWQLAGGVTGAGPASPTPTATIAPPAGVGEPREAGLARHLMVEMAKTRQYSGALLASVAWEAAEEHYRQLDERRQRRLSDGNGEGRGTADGAPPDAAARRDAGEDAAAGGSGNGGEPPAEG